MKIWKTASDHLKTNQHFARSFYFFVFYFLQRGPFFWFCLSFSADGFAATWDIYYTLFTHQKKNYKKYQYYSIPHKKKLAIQGNNLYIFLWYLNLNLEFFFSKSQILKIGMPKKKTPKSQVKNKILFL